MTYWQFDEWLIEQAKGIPCGMNKGSNSQAQAQIDNSVSQAQLGMQQQAFGATFPTVQSIIANGGLTPEAQSALTAQSINSLPQTYNNLYGQLSQQLVARGVTGGQNAGGGDIARTFGSLGAQEAGQAQQDVFNIAGLKQQGLNAALGIGTTQMGQAGSAGTQALGSATTAAGNADQASTGFWGSLFGALGAAGAGIGGGLASRKSG